MTLRLCKRLNLTSSSSTHKSRKSTEDFTSDFAVVRRYNRERDKFVSRLYFAGNPFFSHSGFNDNASGVSVLLELARALAMAECSLEYTVIVVALDLEEYGTQGSLTFVQDFLIPRILEPMGYPGFQVCNIRQTNVFEFERSVLPTNSRKQGAIVLDSVMNFNSSAGSQLFPHDYRAHLPHEVAEAEADGARGDFLAMLSRPFEDQLARRVRFHWDRLQNEDNGERRPKSTLATNKSPEYKLREFRLRDLRTQQPDEDILVNFSNFLRSDHVRFWYANNKDYFASFKGVMLTDTGSNNCFIFLFTGRGKDSK